MIMELKVINVYPDILNLYGDIGNLICIKQRCIWRGIDLKIENLTVDKELAIEEADMILIGGGSDNDQDIVSRHLLKQKKDLENFIDNEKVILAICGSYQMFGNTYINEDNEKIPSLEIFDIETQHQRNRLTGNIIIENNLDLKPKEIIGFENHGGRTYHNYTPLGYVKLGYGNNEEEKSEGMIYKNFIASYLHGPILPKNPHLADYMILNALKNKYDIKSLDKIDDTIEINAHNTVIQRLIKQ
ncbi:MAG: glutamine amidotransferase [Methanobacteriaceae archaeon]|nr:glutamine amidotransferase [Candidatus Methanorudis spinitermitis]